MFLCSPILSSPYLLHVLALVYNCLSVVCSFIDCSGSCAVSLELKWSLYPCNIKPGPLPFSVDIDSAPKEPIERDSIALLSPGAYIILIDGTKSAPVVSSDLLGSETLLAFPRSITAVSASIPSSSFCNITGVPLSDENKSVVPIIQNRIEEKRLIIFVGPYEELPADSDTPQNYLTMASSLGLISINMHLALMLMYEGIFYSFSATWATLTVV
ncbi:hypothetical protein BS47DRAFT_1402912 [Hydnum rufescens UP504]|uniref:Uncharacterized protein n=1 Tax=Hydnum rufescens UP504 TaxID=1448309 RepID=A0A9P6ABY7_9AGAM|nr:hypothetical protein BS47DRAFT_1402912 [Hydnum rufescens UP504]